jgi:chromosome segregation ATPase
MSATPDQLPNDIEEMRRLFLAQCANVEKLTAELAAAKAGLMIYALEIEKLKFQVARLRRQTYGSSSERIEREIAQLELKLEELEAAKAEAEAKAETAASAKSTATEMPASEPAEQKIKKPRRKSRTIFRAQLLFAHTRRRAPRRGATGRCAQWAKIAPRSSSISLATSRCGRRCGPRARAINRAQVFRVLCFARRLSW